MIQYVVNDPDKNRRCEVRVSTNPFEDHAVVETMFHCDEKPTRLVVDRRVAAWMIGLSNSSKIPMWQDFAKFLAIQRLERFEELRPFEVSKSILMRGAE